MQIIKKYLITVIAITLIGELYFYPFDGSFRFSAGVVAFSLVIMLVDDFNIILLSIYTGLSVFALRFIIDLFSIKDEIIEIVLANFPSTIYYILFGILAVFFTVRKNKENPYLMIMTLFSIDVICNLVEAITRSNLNSYLFKFIIIIGLLRSISSCGIYILIENRNNIIRKKEHQKRYMQLNTLVSNIQAELFYLKKSTSDIESVMDKSYSLYKNNKNNASISENALDIARDVHEIKKDYYRVLGGFENFLNEFETNETMSFKDLSFIIEGNSKRYIKENNKDIKIVVTINDNIYIKKYYSLFTILNNLIINSIDAIKMSGSIKILQTTTENNILLYIIDDGGGIDPNVIPYIFNPGFTTKFDRKTGNSSTGIGLSHVKNIIDELDGEIKVESNTKKTEFTVVIPKASLLT
ncbi:two-component system sensor histidine kinase YcbA [Sedimentibacter acidaminivorans]|uniref:histidine kinase n=1 Tax=Sedimentibacter acidaminivorans TaxID=913099 RepID=A0ABS4GA17_9FIRM|nr:ATP-binding protein [Sedimentibacter acidaminivorans]MBP1924516.1 two-component system sensor histidine kinase YcbA [Sedimentibacter acidaminivorans]